MLIVLILTPLLGIVMILINSFLTYNSPWFFKYNLLTFSWKKKANSSKSNYNNESLPGLARDTSAPHVRDTDYFSNINKDIALLFSVITLLISIVIYINFDSNVQGYNLLQPIDFNCLFSSLSFSPLQVSSNLPSLSYPSTFHSIVDSSSLHSWSSSPLLLSNDDLSSLNNLSSINNSSTINHLNSSNHLSTINNTNQSLNMDMNHNTPINCENVTINDLQGNLDYKIILGIDGISLYFVLLTTLIIPITLLADYNNIIKNVDTYLILILLLEFFILTVFLVNDLLIFYIFFEATLPPLFILIGLFGSGNKVKASYYILLYTLLGSLFLLLSIITLINLFDTSAFDLLINQNIPFNLQLLLWVGIFISLAIKTPLAPFHIWLNLAHSEAPLGGSILLASIILKLALYGFLRIMLPILPLACLYFTPFIYVISTITIIWASLTTLRQIDLKRIVAYSSIGHVAVSILGAFSNSVLGISGSILLAIAHGLVSPALFIVVGGFLYSRYHSRVINYYRGLITYYPLLSSFFLFFCLANCGLPLTANFLGEFLCFAGSLPQSYLLVSVSALSIILSAGYSIWLWTRISCGFFSPYLTIFSDLSRREFHIMFTLSLFTILIGISPNFILHPLEYSASLLLIN